MEAVLAILKTARVRLFSYTEYDDPELRESARMALQELWILAEDLEKMCQKYRPQDGA